MAKISEAEFLARTLSPTEKENPRTVETQRGAYRLYLSGVDLYPAPFPLQCPKGH